MVETTLPEGEAAHILPDLTVRIDPKQFRYIDLLHESRHIQQIRRATRDGVTNVFNKNVRGLFEHGAYQYELRLGARFNFSGMYMEWAKSRASGHLAPSIRKAITNNPAMRALWR